MYKATMVDIRVDSDAYKGPQGTGRGRAKLVTLESILLAKCSAQAANQWNKTNEEVRKMFDRHMSLGVSCQEIRQCTGATASLPIWSAPLSTCQRAARSQKENLLAKPQREFIRGHADNGLPGHIGAIVVFDAALDGLDFCELDRKSAEDSLLSVQKRFVDATACTARTTVDNEAYQPYGPLFVKMVVETLSAWPVVKDLLPSHDILSRGPKFVHDWCEKMLLYEYHELYDAEKEISWRLEFDTGLWQTASEQDQGDPVCVDATC